MSGIMAYSLGRPACCPVSCHDHRWLDIRGYSCRQYYAQVLIPAGHGEPVNDSINEDVHQIATSPADNDCLYANTACGVYISEDRGDSWRHRAGDLDDRYGRAIAVSPENPDIILASVSDGPHGEDVHGQLYRSEDRGLSWQHISDTFPTSTANNINTNHVVFDSDGLGWAISGNVLYLGEKNAAVWRICWRAPELMNYLSA